MSIENNQRAKIWAKNDFGKLEKFEKVNWKEKIIKFSYTDITTLKNLYLTLSRLKELLTRYSILVSCTFHHYYLPSFPHSPSPFELSPESPCWVTCLENSTLPLRIYSHHLIQSSVEWKLQRDIIIQLEFSLSLLEYSSVSFYVAGIK